MFLRARSRLKDGSEHRYWSIVENHWTAEGRVVQRQVLYRGGVIDSQKQSWCRTIEVLKEGREQARQVALFPEDRPVKHADLEVIQVRLNKLELHRPRQRGACWLVGLLWEQLKLDEFWAQRPQPSRDTALGICWGRMSVWLNCESWASSWHPCFPCRGRFRRRES